MSDGLASMRFDEYMDEALYGPTGFYTRGGQPGLRGGDFATSVELGSLFGRCIAGYLDRTWHELGRPDPFTVIEGGAGRGKLCLDVLAHVVECYDALRYVMVERVAHQRDAASAAVREPEAGHDAETLEDPSNAVPPHLPVLAAADLPTGPHVGVVLANELLDNLPLRLLERSATGWQEVYVTWAAPGAAAPDAASDAGFVHAAPALSVGPRVDVALRAPTEAVQVLRTAPADAAAMAEALAPDAEPGAQVPLQLRAAVWMRRALGLLGRGRVLVFDYGVRATAELAARQQAEWLRTYRSQRRGHNPLCAPGSADITCEVAFDQLSPGAVLVSQADWLTAAGIDELTADARALWQRHRSSPTAATLAARALLEEAAALTDPAGMGAFWAAEWHVAQ